MTKPTAKHLALGVFVGKWITQGTIRATEDAAASEVRAINTNGCLEREQRQRAVETVDGH